MRKLHAILVQMSLAGTTTIETLGIRKKIIIEIVISFILLFSFPRSALREVYPDNNLVIQMSVLKTNLLY